MTFPLADRTRRKARAASERLRRRFLVVLLARTFRELSDDDATHMAAGVAYYALFSLFPLLLGLIAILGLVIDSETLQVEITGWTADHLPGAGDFITDNIDISVGQSGSLGIISIIGLIWAGSAIFGAINRAVNRAWDVHEDRPFYVAKARQLVMALGVGILFFLALASASLAQAADRFAEVDLPLLGLADEAIGVVLFRGTSFLFNLAIFLVLYKFLPNTRTYWRYIWPGALVATFLFEAGKDVFIFYVENFASFNQVYGSIGSVIALLFWAYLSALILIFGAELSSEYGRMREGVERGTLIQPYGEPSPPDRPDQRAKS